MSKPSTIPTWNTGGANRSTPSGGKISTGWALNEQPASSYFNFLMNLYGVWLTWLDSVIIAGDGTGVEFPNNLTVDNNALIVGQMHSGSVLTTDLTAAGTSNNSIGIPSRTAPSLLNSWANIGGASQTAAYWKDAFGVVHLEGHLNAAAATNGTIFTLPAGFRPPADLHFTVSNNVSGADRITISASSGNVSYNGTIGSANNIALDGITFRNT